MTNTLILCLMLSVLSMTWVYVVVKMANAVITELRGIVVGLAQVHFLLYEIAVALGCPIERRSDDRREA